MLLQVLLLYHFQNRQTYCTRDIVAAKRAEKLHSVVKRVGNRSRCNHCADRMSIANRFTEHNDIRNHIVLLESIEVGANPSIRGLNLIRNTDSSRTAYQIVNSSQIALRKNDLSGNAWQRLANETTEAWSYLRDQVGNLCGVQFCSR